MARQKRSFWAKLGDSETPTLEDPRDIWEKIRDARDLVAQVRLDLGQELLFQDTFKMQDLRHLEERIDPVITGLDELYRDLQQTPLRSAEEKTHRVWP